MHHYHPPPLSCHIRTGLACDTHHAKATMRSSCILLALVLGTCAAAEGRGANPVTSDILKNIKETAAAGAEDEAHVEAPEEAVPCTSHSVCEPHAFFCEANTKMCHDCAECHQGKDSIDGKCPEWCEPSESAPEKKKCEVHAECAKMGGEEADEAGFCTLHETCQPCSECHTAADGVDDTCPAWCPRPACKAHADCASRASNFCSSRSGKCEECSECRDADAAEGKCPTVCPAAGLKCALNAECKETFFCSSAKTCVACTECHQDHDAVGKDGCLRRCGNQPKDVEDPDDEAEHDEM